MKITQSELKRKYGITLPRGKYSIHKEGDLYEVYSVKDDTLGCPLLGRNKVKGMLVESKDCINQLMELAKKNGYKKVKLIIEREYSV